MRINEFKKLPDLEGFTIAGVRLGGVKRNKDPAEDEVVGFVLLDKQGNKRYILLFGNDLRVEDYW